VLLGGCVAAILTSAAQAHFTNTLAKLNQPDVHTLHIEFFRPCTPHPSTITVTDLKIGKGSCFIQLTLHQNNQPRCTALATSTNFSIDAGPTIKTSVPFYPALAPLPNFKNVANEKPDENWLPSKTHGQILPFLKRMTFLYPSNGQPTPGIIDYWCTFDVPERMSLAHLAMLSDVAPSASDTLLRTDGVFDAHKIYLLKKEAAEKTPGKPAVIVNSLKEAGKATIWNTTLSLDLQFKRRVGEGDRWMFTRCMTRKLEGGRMDLDLGIYDEGLEVVCLARQCMLVIDGRRRFKKENGEKEKEKGAKL
jgi:acyl-CoA thioesterase FadM